MFLYAKVVLKNLLSKDSVAELKEELSKENFPAGLEAAYERVVVRVLDRPPLPRKRTARTILGWLICSPRPLRWREIQSRFCINPEKEVCDYDNRRYLFQSSRFSLAAVHGEMGLFCTQYLSSRPFSIHRTQDEIKDSALNGYYGLFDYAVTSWAQHVRFALASDTAPMLDDETRNAIRQVAQGLLETQPEAFTVHDVEEEVEVESTGSQSPGLIAPKLDNFLSNDGGLGFFSDQVSLIRDVIEKIEHSALSDSSPFTGLNGHGRFKCPRTRCLKFTEGFPNRQDRDRHILEHQKPFKCPVEGCYAQTIGYKSQQELEAHDKRLHAADFNFQSLFSIRKKRKARTIHQAVIQGNIEQVMLFHKSGASLDNPPKNNGSATPLMLAAKNGHMDICKYILEHGGNPFRLRLFSRESALFHVIKRQDAEMVHLFLATASSHIPTASVKYFREAVAQAVYSDNLNVFNQILEFSSQRIDIKSEFEVAEFLLDFLPKEYLLNTDDGGDTLLHRLISGLYRTITISEDFKRLFCRVLEANVATANITDSHGNLPLHRYIARVPRASSVILKPLIRYTTRLDEENEQGQTPLEIAIRDGNDVAVSLLLESGRDDFARKPSDGNSMQQLAEGELKSHRDSKSSKTESQLPIWQEWLKKRIRILELLTVTL
ncbi:ankyrin repeat-containing domain protein [Podospora fimiseda]|uniref:Ankyrin repeat-containing domain protein n=1 Tax=Podospora fimiseda TaxID=252190 RepID=A0AAN7H4X3_9PEZI|nr:ankyrin repeat-containing domain protein [Podospora fimiseda]